MLPSKENKTPFLCNTLSYPQVLSSSAGGNLTVISNISHILSANCKMRTKIKASLSEAQHFQHQDVHIELSISASYNNTAML